MLTIQNRMYAATMVELPAVIESLKSWNKKDWVKTADVCQMLLVLDEVKNEDEARKFPLPSYISPDTHRFPHGLTPPMKWARKRRFRPRKSYIDVERAEAQLNRLIENDATAVSTKYEMVDSEAESSEESSSEEEVDDDEEMANATQVEEMDADQLEQMLAEGLMDDEVEFQGDNDQLNALLAGNNNVQVEQVDTPTTAHDVAMHALGQNGNVVETETAASTPAAATSADDDDDDDDADSDEDVDEVDEAAAAEEQRQEQLRGEIAELERAIVQSTEARDRQTNVLFKKRVQTQIDKQKADLAIKRKQLGNEEADE
jgi:transcription initiation factor TFIID subunit 7